MFRPHTNELMVMVVGGCTRCRRPCSMGERRVWEESAPWRPGIRTSPVPCGPGRPSKPVESGPWLGSSHGAPSGSRHSAACRHPAESERYAAGMRRRVEVTIAASPSAGGAGAADGAAAARRDCAVTARLLASGWCSSSSSAPRTTGSRGRSRVRARKSRCGCGLQRAPTPRVDERRRR